MALTLDGLAIRKRLGRHHWKAPRPFGADGWIFKHHSGDGTIIVTAAPHDGREWIHASISFAFRMPEYADMVRLHHGAFNGSWAYEVFAPPEYHVNIHEFARHLWGRADGGNALPSFGIGGTI